MVRERAERDRRLRNGQIDFDMEKDHEVGKEKLQVAKIKQDFN